MSWKKIIISAETRTKMLERASKLPQDSSRIVHQFPDGWTIRELKTIGDHWRESRLMSNCLFTGMTHSMINNLDRWLQPCSKCNKTPCRNSLSNLTRMISESCEKVNYSEMKSYIDTANIKSPIFKIMGEYADKYASEPTQIKYYSIRDPDNIPHITAGSGQILGRHNAEPNKKYYKYFEELDYLLDEDGNILGPELMDTDDYYADF